MGVRPRRNAGDDLDLEIEAGQPVDAERRPVWIGLPGKNLLLLARNNDLDHPRLGLVIGKKSVKLSVERNRLKRLMRESFRLNQDSLVGWDIVIVARKGLGDVENPELIQHFGKLWKRLARSKPVPAVKAETVGVDSPDA